jgi:predicted nucleic acid-binding protein
LLEALRETGRVCVSAQLLSELYVTLTRRVEPPLPPRDAEAAVSAFAVGWPVVPVTAEVVQAAISATRRYRLHFWDALIWAAAKVTGAAVVLSEDFQHGRALEGVLFLNPFRDDFELPPSGA